MRQTLGQSAVAMRELTKYHASRLTKANKQIGGRMQSQTGNKKTFATRPGGRTWIKGTRTTFNNSRFEDLPPEMIFAEVILLEV